MFFYQNISLHLLDDPVPCVEEINCRLCLFVVAAPFSELEKGRNTCCSEQVAVWRRPESLSTVCLQLWSDLRTGRDCMLCKHQHSIHNKIARTV